MTVHLPINVTVGTRVGDTVLNVSPTTNVGVENIVRTTWAVVPARINWAKMPRPELVK